MTEKEIKKLAKKQLRKQRLDNCKDDIVYTVLLLLLAVIESLIILGVFFAPHLIVIKLKITNAWLWITGAWASILPLGLIALLIISFVVAIKEDVEAYNYKLSWQMSKIRAEEEQKEKD